MSVLGAEYLTAAAGPEGWPPGDRPEVALMGRSNVGKSSLLNRLVGARRLARTSRTPGKTRLLQFFRVRRRDAGELLLVDLPGYGFARVSKSERGAWQKLIERYLGERENLRVAVLLQDVRREVSDDERNLVDWLDERGVPVVLAVTKSDKLVASKRPRRVAELAAQLEIAPERAVCTSSSKNIGVDELWRLIERFVDAVPAEG